MSQMIEVFKLTPIPGKFYETVHYTVKMGTFPYETYLTDKQPMYIGKFIKSCSYGHENHVKQYYLFDDHGKETKIYYTYKIPGDMVCFREVLENMPLSEIGMDGSDICNEDTDNSYEAVPETNEDSEPEVIRERETTEEKYPIYKRLFCPYKRLFSPFVCK